MFTTGFKFYFGLGLVLLVAAVVYGYASGGGNVGPISLGWKGGVGEQIGYGVLTGLGTAAVVVGLFVVAYRDADPAAQAHLLGVDTVATNPPTTDSFWPVVGAFAVATSVVGLVLHPAVFVLGLVVLAVVLVEWTMDAWADRATGDAEANRALRDRIMAPIEIPLFGALGIGVGVLAVSRVLLSVSQDGAVIVAGLVALAVLGGGALYAAKPGVGRNAVAGLAVLAAVGLLAAGVIAAVVGERDFEEHHDETEEESDAEEGSGE